MNQKTADWMAAARTPETRARIRRWAILRSVFLALTLASACGFVVTLVVSMVLAVFFGEEPPWWRSIVALCMVLATVVLWCISWVMLGASQPQPRGRA